MNIRAYSIIEDQNRKRYIVCQFNHDRHIVLLASWGYPLDVYFVRKLMPLPHEKEISLSELDDMKLMLSW